MVINLAGQGGFGQSGANRGSDLPDTDGVLEDTLAAIGKRDGRHRCNSL